MKPEIILARTGIDVTTIQQGDESWHRLRLGVITASEVHNVISKPRSGKKWTDMKMSYFHTLLAEVCTGVAPEVNAKALAWGNRLSRIEDRTEDTSKRKVRKNRQQLHENHVRHV